MKWKYALAESRKWREHVSRDCDAFEIGSTHFLIIESGGNMSAMIVLLMKWKYATHWLSLRVECGGNMSAVIVLLMKWKYALSESQK